MKKLVVASVALVLFVGALGAYIYIMRPPWGDTVKPLYWRSIYLIGRADGCSWADASRPLNQTLMPIAGQEYRNLKEIRSDGDLTLYQTSLGEFWAPPGTSLNLMIAEQRVGVYDESIEVQPGDTVLDVGANIGVFSKLSLQKGAELAIAVEPSPGPLAALRRNLEPYIGSGRAIIVPKAAWDEAGSMKMATLGDSVLDSFVMRQDWEEAQFVDVEMVRLDDELKALGLGPVDFIKMDIEGAERQALDGLLETIRRDQPRMVIATEHLASDVYVVPEIIHQAVGGYEQESSPCRAIGLFLMRPEALYFRPPVESSRR